MVFEMVVSISVPGQSHGQFAFLVAIVQEVHLELCLGIRAVAPASSPSCHHLVKELSVLILLLRSSP